MRSFPRSSHVCPSVKQQGKECCKSAAEKNFCETRDRCASNLLAKIPEVLVVFYLLVSTQLTCLPFEGKACCKLAVETCSTKQGLGVLEILWLRSQKFLWFLIWLCPRSSLVCSKSGAEFFSAKQRIVVRWTTCTFWLRADCFERFHANSILVNMMSRQCVSSLRDVESSPSFTWRLAQKDGPISEAPDVSGNLSMARPRFL